MSPGREKGAFSPADRPGSCEGPFSCPAASLSSPTTTLRAPNTAPTLSCRTLYLFLFLFFYFSLNSFLRTQFYMHTILRNVAWPKGSSHINMRGFHDGTIIVKVSYICGKMVFLDLVVHTQSQILGEYKRSKPNYISGLECGNSMMANICRCKTRNKAPTHFSRSLLTAAVSGL